MNKIIFTSFHSKIVLFLLIPLTSLILHFRVFSLDPVGIHVWRQSLTMTVIDNFAEGSANILEPKINETLGGDGISRLEFPLMQWSVGMLCKIFGGSSIFIARIFMFIVGLFSVWGIYRMIFLIFKEERIATLTAWAFNFSPLFYYYTLNPIPDPMAMCFSIWSIVFFLQWVKEQRNFLIALSFTMMTLAALIKLPFILTGAFPIVYTAIHLKHERMKYFKLLFFAALSKIPVVLWYINATALWGGTVTKGLFSDSEFGLEFILDILSYNLISALPENLINYASLLFFLAGIFFMFRNKVLQNKYFKAYALWGLAILAYFLFEMKLIARIHDYYLFPFLPVIFILVAYGIKNLLQLNKRWLTILCSVCIFILPLTAYLRMDQRWDTASPGFNVDLLNNYKVLAKVVPDSALCVAGADESHFIYLYYLHKKGWAYNKSELHAENLKYMIEHGARYLYCDERTIDEDPSIRPLLGPLLFEKGMFRVYPLKIPE